MTDAPQRIWADPDYNDHFIEHHRFPHLRRPISAEEYAKYPRVKVYARRAWHFFGWEAGVAWSRRPIDDVYEGDLLYRRRFGIEIKGGLWRFLRDLVRIVW